MTSLSLILGLAAIAGAIVLGAIVLISGPAKATGAEVSVALDAPPARARAAGVDEPIPPLMVRLAGLAARLSPSSYGGRLQRRLDLAGNPAGWPAERIMAFKGLGLVFGALFGALLGAHGGVRLFLYAAIGAAVGFFLPDLLVRNIGEKRQLKLRNALPDALDMLTVCVEAGLGFDAALARVARNLEGSMAEECARVLQEMQFGLSRTEALRALANRTNVPEIKIFVSALIQASELGISVGVVLREQAKEMRVRRRQRAEEKAQKLPVKILLPLITCLLPAMFVVVLGPAAIKIVHTFATLGGG